MPDLRYLLKSEVFEVDCDWSDAELATIPCAYGTAENMVHRAGVGAGDRILVTGASGAIAGPMVNMDMRDFYLKDLTLIGCTAWDEPVFPNLAGYIERGEIRPLVAETFALKNIAVAQREFLKKRHVGNFVLLPPRRSKRPPWQNEAEP